ncbi:ATP-dependent DNA helicase RecQ [Mucinivorans hirudinis]|uniref:DNA helicase RecQ n=1 Tax=Mucinivorans hirudinis TaxID=1433126 RepID=A0A060RBR6_9BACT|nr:ATP-dependent DNA helicase RecQ [Mucinivorans hirudinis]
MVGIYEKFTNFSFPNCNYYTNKMSKRNIEAGSDTLFDSLKRYFGFDQFKGNQEDVIRNLLAGNDTFVLMPTGGGKSLCYQLPALMMEGLAIVISPLIALMKNQVDAMRGFSTEEGVAHFLNSSLNKSAALKVREDVLAGKTKLLYFAPESLTKEENVEFLRKVKISFYAIDEAHCISEWGHDFRPEYRRIRPIIAEIGQAPLIALTATATPKVQLDIQKNLGMMNAKVFKSSFNRQNLYYEVRPKENTTKEIIRYIKKHEGKSGIIYCLSRKKVEELADLLRVNDIKALPYHAGIDATTRAENQDKFLMEEVDVIVATIAFGMGIDKPDVRFVIHYDIPKSLEGYYQETGRGGRDGGVGECITFYSYKDILKLEKFMQGKPLAEQEIGKLLLSETVAYAESTICRRKLILHYFGEKYEQENCGSCDNCLNPVAMVEAKDDMALLLDVLATVGSEFKPDHLVNILIGRNNNIIKSYNHNELEEFGAGEKKEEGYWSAVLRQGLIRGYISKDIENYGSIAITERGREFVEKPISVKVSKDRIFEESDIEDSVATGPKGSGGSAAADEELFSMLKDLRKQLSKRLNLPPFVIFQDPSLEDMAIQYPVSMEDMQHIQGVGMGKARKFAGEFIKLIARYVEEKEIVRPQDLVLRSVVNKSGNKVFIIQSVDKKMDLVDIAEAKGMSGDDLLDELEAIVNSGTKININYYIEREIDEDKVEDIIDYFREAESDSVAEAEKELGAGYTQEEIRLVRIKFLSEMGN